MNSGSVGVTVLKRKQNPHKIVALLSNKKDTTNTTQPGPGKGKNPEKGVTCTDSTAPTPKQSASYLPDVLCHILGVNENREQAVDVLLKLVVAF